MPSCGQDVAVGLLRLKWGFGAEEAGICHSSRQLFADIEYSVPSRAAQLSQKRNKNNATPRRHQITCHLQICRAVIPDDPAKTSSWCLKGATLYPDARLRPLASAGAPIVEN
jgi:hypothetical protein